jgi:lysophospholipase
MGWEFDEHRTRDGLRLRTGMWSVRQPRGHCLIIQGRGDYLEKHAEAAARLAALGLTVVSVDLRGQGASSRLRGRAGTSDVVSFDDHLDDLEEVLGSRSGLVGPRLVLSHSMGGLLTVQHLLRWPQQVAAAVLLSPMFAFRGAPPPAVVAGLAAAAVTLGFGGALAPGERVADPEHCDLATNMSTDDPDGFARLQPLQRAHRDLVVEGGTWRWVRAANRAIRQVARADLARITTDVLIASSPTDPGVDPAAHHSLAARLPAARVRTYAGRHDLLFASPATVETLWQDIASHLTPHLGPPS